MQPVITGRQCAGAATGRMTSAACVQWLSACSPASASKTHSSTLRRSRRTRANIPLLATMTLLVYLQQCAAQGPHLHFVSASEVSVAPLPGPKRSFEGGTVVRTSDGVHHLFTADQTYGIVSGSALATRMQLTLLESLCIDQAALITHQCAPCVSRCTKHSPEPAHSSSRHRRHCSSLQAAAPV
jgi:hypothetical protein